MVTSEGAMEFFIIEGYSLFFQGKDYLFALYFPVSTLLLVRAEWCRGVFDCGSGENLVKSSSFSSIKDEFVGYL